MILGSRWKVYGTQWKGSATACQDRTTLYTREIAGHRTCPAVDAYVDQFAQLGHGADQHTPQQQHPPQSVQPSSRPQSQALPPQYASHAVPTPQLQRHSWNPEVQPHLPPGGAARNRNARYLSGSGLPASGGGGPDSGPAPVSLSADPTATTPPKTRAVSSAADAARSWRTSQAPPPGGVASSNGGNSQRFSLTQHTAPPSIVIGNGESARPGAFAGTAAIAGRGDDGASSPPAPSAVGLNKESGAVTSRRARLSMTQGEGAPTIIQPTRQPRGPPTGQEDLLAQNFTARKNAKTRRDAISFLSNHRDPLPGGGAPSPASTAVGA